MSIQQILEKTKGPCVVLAGAGTGKTHTIAEKIKYLVQNNIYKPEKIVCITFSNEAANNLLLRVEKALGIAMQDEKKPIIRTFHGFSADLLREHGDKIGISKDFKILDPDQAKVILHRNLKINPGNCHKYISTIGTAKDLGIKLEALRDFSDKEIKRLDSIDLEKKMEALSFELQTLHLRKEWYKKKELVLEIQRLKSVIELKNFVSAWNAYEKLKHKGDYQDYSDLNANSLILLEKNGELAKDYDYIIVDEFQDTNKLQLDFLIQLCPQGNITVVGDMNQSIYRFRGAYKDNFNLFRRAFQVKEEDVFNLSESYRSSNIILKAAHKLVLNNYQNKEECFFVQNVHSREGGKIEVYEMRDSREEARKVVELVKQQMEQGTALEEICIMFRAHQHSAIIKKALQQSGIPFYSVSKSSLLKQKSVKTARDYLIVLNALKKKEKGAEASWWDLFYQLDFPKEDLVRIGRTIKDFLGNRRKDAGEVKKASTPAISETISIYLLNNLEKVVSEEGRMAAKIILDKIKAMLPSLDKPISQLLQEIYRISGLINGQKTKEEKESMLNLNKFYELAKMHEELYESGLDSFLYYLNILESLGIEIPSSQLEESGVRLMTSHSTKGLEYKTVIITNLAQGRFPIERYVSASLLPTELLPEVKGELQGLSEEEKEQFVINYEKHHQLLEERRLCYVSFTRAKDNLILTYAKQYASREFYPSCFLAEIGYKNNPDMNFKVDNEIKYQNKEADINKRDFSLTGFLSADKIEELPLLENAAKKEEARKLSPSALLLFDDCQKQFEYKYVYNMPEKKSISWQAIRLGSFVHIILEQGVSAGFSRVEQFLELARELSVNEDWESIALQEAETLVKVFFERHKGKYKADSKTEQYLPLQLSGIGFIGFADRIDFTSNGAEIVDYKTGKSYISPKDRNWQLGFYALAAQEKYGRVRKVVLDMLKQERPLEFEIDEKGNAVCISSKFIDGFNIFQVRDELIETAKKIQEAYKSGFLACPPEKNCDFCNEYVYGL